MIDQTIREKKRARRSLSYMNEGEYFPHLYESDNEMQPQLSYVLSERAPWPLEDVSILVVSMF
jgi:hypothetical protein